MRAMNELPVIIIGAGIGGLSAAIWLASAGQKVIIFEKNNGPGGKMSRLQADGFTWDRGNRGLAAFRSRPGGY